MFGTTKYFPIGLEHAYINGNLASAPEFTPSFVSNNWGDGKKVICSIEVYEENRKEKHAKDAKFGWFSYDSRFALPVFGANGDIERYNVFNVAMLVRHDADGKCYLYDIMKIKKRNEQSFQVE